jgi:hypothetical protein
MKSSIPPIAIPKREYTYELVTIKQFHSSALREGSVIGGSSRLRIDRHLNPSEFKSNAKTEKTAKKNMP